MLQILIAIGLALLNISVGAIGVTLYSRIKILQDNHIHDIIERLVRLENKLDKHLEYHLESK